MNYLRGSKVVIFWFLIFLIFAHWIFQHIERKRVKANCTKERAYLGDLAQLRYDLSRLADEEKVQLNCLFSDRGEGWVDSKNVKKVRKIKIGAKAKELEEKFFTRDETLEKVGLSVCQFGHCLLEALNSSQALFLRLTSIDFLKEETVTVLSKQVDSLYHGDTEHWICNLKFLGLAESVASLLAFGMRQNWPFWITDLRVHRIKEDGPLLDFFVTFEWCKPNLNQ